MILILFITFAKIGLFTFSGGYAMISIIENICVEKKISPIILIVFSAVLGVAVYGIN